MSDDDNRAAAELAPRSWRNYTRSRRAHDLHSDLATEDDMPEPTEWWKTDDKDDAT